MAKNHILKYKADLMGNLLTPEHPLNLIFELFQVCQIMASLNTGRKKRDLVNCADCCADAPNENGPCNAALCGLSKLPTDWTNWVQPSIYMHQLFQLLFENKYSDADTVIRCNLLSKLSF